MRMRTMDEKEGRQFMRNKECEEPAGGEGKTETMRVCGHGTGYNEGVRRQQVKYSETQ